VSRALTIVERAGRGPTGLVLTSGCGRAACIAQAECQSQMVLSYFF